MFFLLGYHTFYNFCLSRSSRIPQLPYPPFIRRHLFNVSSWSPRPRGRECHWCVSTRCSDPSLLTSRLCITGGHPHPPQRIQISQPRPSQEEMNHSDGSWPLYAMYSKIAQEEDRKVAEHNQQAADGILIFVSPSCYIPVATFLTRKT